MEPGSGGGGRRDAEVKGIACMKSEIRNPNLRVGAKTPGGTQKPSRIKALTTLVAVAAVILIGWQSVGAEPGTPVAPAGLVDTNGQETVRSYLQLQEQLHATQLAIERNRREADEAAAETAKILAGRLQTIEQALATQRAQELQAMQSSNKVMLIVAGSFAALGLSAMLFMAYFQWRTVSRLAEVSAALPGGHGLGAGNALA